MIDRLFEKSEVFLLCNAIYSSNFIPSKNSKELIKKILKTQSKHCRDIFKSNIYVDSNYKKENKDFFYNIETLSEAIKNKKTVSFNYLKYDKNKELIKRREEKYKVFPYSMVYMNEKTYLICRNTNKVDISHYRIDKIRNIEEENIKYEPYLKINDAYLYAKTKLYMYKGEEIKIAIKCNYLILDDIIDYFGKEINVYEQDENYFITYVKSSKQGMIYFALQYIKYLQVLEPQEIKDEITNILKLGLKKYSED